MKKRLLIFTFLCGLFLVFGGIKASAKIPAGIFLPQGYNYLDPENIYYTPIDGDNQGYLRSRSDLAVKDETDYCIYCIDTANVYFDSACIEYWDPETEDLLELECECDEDIIYFSTPIGGDKIKIEFSAVNRDNNTNVELWDVGANYVMAEEGTVDTNNLDNYAFSGYNVNGSIITTPSIRINTLASNPITYSQIINYLYVYDFTDGIINNKKEVTKNTYGTSDYQVGDFEIDVTVKNKRDVSSNLVINIHVADDINPVISGPDEYTMRNIDNKTLDDVKATLTATDNYDGDISSSITVDTNNDAFTGRQTDLGTFPVRFQVSDEAGNIGFHVVNVSVVQGDFNGPVFSGTFSYERLTTEPLTEAEILSHITASDDYSGDVTSRIQVLYNDYKYNTNRVGTYRISLYVKDNAGNATRKDISIKVYENSAPTFVYDPVVLYIPLKSNMESTSDIIRLLQKTGYFSNDEVIVESDSYSENKNALGQYIITLKQDEVERTVLVNVEEGMEYLNCIELPKTVEYNFDYSSRPAFLNMIYDVCCRVKAFFKDFFDAIF